MYFPESFLKAELPGLLTRTGCLSNASGPGKVPGIPYDHSSLSRTKVVEQGPLLWRCTLPWQQLMLLLTLRRALTQAVVPMVTSRVQGP